MRPRSTILALSVALLAAGWLAIETRRLAELAGRHEIAARTAAGDAGRALAERDALRAAHDARAAAAARLEGELALAQTQLAAMAEELQKATARAEQRAAAAEAAAARALAPLPEGVRSCLQNLHDCLRAEGYANQRFLSARALDGEGLHDVELIDTHPDGLGAAVVQAARMTAELDRAEGRLELRFFDGSRSDGGERQPLPKDGLPLVFAPIDPRLFEERLPFLVRAHGVLPAEPTTARAALPTDLDPLTRLAWLERFDRLLAAAGTPEELRIERCRGLHGGFFLDVQVLGSDDKHHLVLTADCRRLAVEVDAAAGVVSLLLQDGSLKKRGVESTITAEGFRMLLPKVSPKMASDVMLGMVVTK